MIARRLPVLLAVALSALPSAPAASASEGVAEAGKPPPLFKLADEEGRVHDLEQLLGTPTVLYFTHNMCHYCTQVIGFLKRARQTYDEDELTIWTINVWADGPKMIRRYKEQFGLPFPMVAGKDPQVLRDYEVNYVPIIVFLDRHGNIHKIFHHYILKTEFDATVEEIVAGVPPHDPGH